MKRDLQHPAVQSAKTNAVRLRQSLKLRGVDVSQGESLEITSQSMGYSDWNTARASLMRTPLNAKAEESAALLIGYKSRAAEVVSGRLIALTREEPIQNTMWYGRMASMIEAVIGVLIYMRDECGVDLTFQHIQKSLNFTSDEDLEREFSHKDPMSMVQLYRFVETQKSNDERLVQFKRFFDTVPCFSHEKAMLCEKQEVKTYEQIGFLTMLITRPFEELSGDLGF